MRRSRGLTIPEVLVAGLLLGILMELIVSSLTVLERSKSGLMARTEPRQQLRAFLGVMKSDLRHAAYIYPQGTYDIMGTTVVTPGEDQEGNGIIFAIPETDASPVTYKVCHVFTRKRTTPDPHNPDAYEAVYYYVEGVAPTNSDLPSEIDPNTLTGGSLKVFDTYIEGLSGFVTNLTETGYGVTYHAKFKKIPPNGETTQQELGSTVVLRNGL